MFSVAPPKVCAVGAAVGRATVAVRVGADVAEAVGAELATVAAARLVKSGTPSY